MQSQMDIFQQTVEKFNDPQSVQDELKTIESAISQAILRAEKYNPRSPEHPTLAHQNKQLS